jgi:hypothetical protein
MGEDKDLECVNKLKDSTTFPMWAFEIKIVFESKKLISYVDGTTTLEAQGNNTEKVETWNTKDAPAKRIILRTVENSVKVHLMACKNPRKCMI